MSTLIAITSLGIICLLLEIINQRKLIIPITLLGFLLTIGLNICEFNDQPIINMDSSGMMVSGKFQNIFNILFVVLAGLVVLMSPQFYKDRIVKLSDYVSLKIFMLAGAVAMVGFGNLIMFFLGLEVLSISAYVLASAKPENIKSNEAGMKYFILGAVASSFILFGIALIYGALATFDVSLISQLILRDAIFNSGWLSLGVLMLCVGMFFKASIFPFHFWAPDVYEGAPTINTAIMSTLVKVAALSSFFYIGSIFYFYKSGSMVMLISILAVMTMTLANITALKQKNIKRLMAYSGISHAGFMLLTLIGREPGLALDSIIYYCAAYSIASLVTFAIIMIVCQNKEGEDVSLFYGLFRKKPILSCMMILALMSLGGIPFLAGFFAKYILFMNLIASDAIIVAIACVVNSIIAVYYYLGLINVMFKKDVTEQIIIVNKRYYSVALIASILLVVLSVVSLKDAIF